MKKILAYIAVTFLTVGFVSAQKIDKNVMPKAGQTPVVNLAKPKTFKLSNGLTVLVVENHKLPRVNIGLTIDRMPLLEGKITGVGTVLSDQLGNGTASLSKDEFNEKVESMGANLHLGTSGAYANMLSKYFVDVMELLADAVKNPRFDAEEIKKSIDRNIEGLKTEEKSAKAIAGNVFGALRYGKGTPDGEFETEASLKRITKGDVEKYYKMCYTPKTAYLAIVGDVEYKKVKKMVRKLFADWKAEAVSNDFAHNYKNIEKTTINVVDVPTAVQSVIYVGNFSDVKKNDQRLFSAKVGNYVLGGGSLESRLNMNLREKNAFTYGAYSGLSAHKYTPATFVAQTSVRNEVAAKAVKELISEFNKCEDITTEELNNAKSQLKGRFIMSLENPGNITSYAISQLMNNLPEDYYTNYLKSVDNVTKSTVAEVMKGAVLPNQMNILVVGKGSAIADDLEALGYPVKYFDKDANPTKKPEVKKIAKGVTVKTIAEKYIEAIGGKSVVENVKSLGLNAIAKVQGMEMEMIVINALGGKNRMEMKMMGNTVQKMVFDGNVGYIEAQGQKQPMQADAIAKMKQNKYVFPELGFAQDAECKLVGIETVNGKDAYCIKKGSKSYYYCVKTGLKLQEIESQKAGNREIKVPVQYSEYKVVDGVKLPFRLEQNMMGQKIIFNINSYSINTAIDEDFK